MLKLTERRVQQLAAAGVLPKATRGRYDLIECVGAYILYLRDENENLKRLKPGGVTALEEERARLTAARAGLAELDERERQGELVPAAQIERFLSAVFSRVRQGILSLPSRVAPRAFDAKTIPECERLILEACTEALTEISETKIAFKTIHPGSAGARAAGRPTSKYSSASA